MGTRSLIALQSTEGAIKSIYCHWDGKPYSNGFLLLNHYQTAKKVKQLLELGDISALYENITPTAHHTFDNPQKGVVIAYHRDRGDEYSAPTVWKDKRDIAAHAWERHWAEYVYVFEEGKWIYCEALGENKGIWLTLTEEICYRDY